MQILSPTITAATPTTKSVVGGRNPRGTPTTKSVVGGRNPRGTPFLLKLIKLLSHQGKRPIIPMQINDIALIIT